MKISVVYNQVYNCLMGKYVGVLEPQHVQEYIDKVLEKAKVHDCKRFLNDMREAEIRLTITDLYYVSYCHRLIERSRSCIPDPR